MASLDKGRYYEEPLTDRAQRSLKDKQLAPVGVQVVR